MSDVKFGHVAFASAGSTDAVISVLVNELIDEVLEVPTDPRLDWE